MPVMERNLNELKDHAEPAADGFVTQEEEYEILNAAHSDVSAAKTYKIKIKIEEKKKQEEIRKNYTNVIHNTVSKNIINAHASSGNFATKLAESKASGSSRSSAM